MSAILAAVVSVATVPATAEVERAYGEIGGGWVTGARPEVDYIGIPIGIDPVDSSEGWSAHALIGADLGRFRTELEVQHLRGAKRTFEVTRVEIDPGTVRTDAQNRLTAVTVNGAIDILETGDFVLFALGGAGMGWSDDETAVLDITTVTPASTRSDEEFGFVAQAGAGLRWQMTERLALVPSWRHVWSFAGAETEYDSLRLGLRLTF